MKKKLSILYTASAILLWGCGDDSSTSPNDLIDTFSSAEESSSSSFKDNALSSSRKELSTTSSCSAESSSSSLVFSSSSETTFSYSEISSSQQTSSSSNLFHPCSEAPALKENWKYLNTDIEYGCFMDSRDNQYYATIKIGDYTWMAENLAYDYRQAPRTIDSWYGYSKKGADVQNQRGYLYTWDLAMADTNCRNSNLCKPRGQMRGICPEGFHIPSYWEWQDLFNAVGGVDIAARELKSTEVWADSAKGTNKYGFSAIPNGPRYGGEFNPVDFNTVFWTSDESGKNVIVTIGFVSNDRAHSMTHENKEFAFSIRCLMDYPEQETPYSGISHDPDKIYQCDEMLMDDINTWHFKDDFFEKEYQYFIDDSDSISVRIKDPYSDYTTRSSHANNEEGLYIMFWAALNSCLPL